MSVEYLVKRTLWVSECPSCGDRVEKADNPPRERQCRVCKVWVPFVATSYVGPDIKSRP